MKYFDPATFFYYFWPIIVPIVFVILSSISKALFGHDILILKWFRTIILKICRFDEITHTGTSKIAHGYENDLNK